MSISEKSILIVDDMKMVRTKLKQICNQIGIQKVYEAGDGEQALALLKKLDFDLVLCDWNMPNMTGIELVDELRKESKWKSLPVIFVTSEDQKDNILKSLMGGVTDYVVKPFADAVVKQKIFASLKAGGAKGNTAQ